MMPFHYQRFKNSTVFLDPSLLNQEDSFNLSRMVFLGPDEK